MEAATRGREAAISGRALILLLAVAAALRSGSPNMGAIASIDADVSQLLAFWAEVVVRRRIMGEPINGVEPIILVCRAVARAHIRRDVLLLQPVQHLAVSIRCIGSKCLRHRPSSRGETREHVPCRYTFLAQARRCCLNADDDAAAVIDQIVVVVAELGRATFACVSRISGRPPSAYTA